MHDTHNTRSIVNNLGKIGVLIVKWMNDKTKLILAMMQIDNISNLMKDNEWEQFMVSHLIPLQVEIQRQLTNLNRPESK